MQIMQHYHRHVLSQAECIAVAVESNESGPSTFKQYHDNMSEMGLPNPAFPTLPLTPISLAVLPFQPL